LLLLLNVAMVLSPDSFGLPDAATAVRISFLSVALWWALFSLPVLLFVPERGGLPARAAPVAGAFRELGSAYREVRAEPRIATFLLAYWLYIDGVDTIVRMAVDYGLALGFDSSDLLAALLVTQFVGFPAAMLFGRIGERIGAKRGILLGIAVYAGAVVWAYHMNASWEFYGLAVLIGLVQGGVQSLSRSFYAQLIPKAKAAMFFGFYNMLGKFAAVLGPLLVGAVAWIGGDSRLGILMVLLLFGAGAALLVRVRPPQQMR
jgi:UMF1 family MFS transporter